MKPAPYSNARALRVLLNAALCAVALLIGGATVPAQSADKVLKQAIKAMGGEKVLRRVNAWETSGVITRCSDGATGRYQATAMRPHLYTVNWEIGGFEASIGFTGKSSWRRDSRNGLRTLTGKASDDFRAEAAHRNRRWLDYKKDRMKLSYAGAVTVNDRAAHAIILANLHGAQTKLYIDAASGLPVREELSEGDVKKSFEYGDYRAIDGVMEPFTVTLTEGEDRYDIRIEKITHNPPFNRTIFDLPRRSSEPVLDVGALLAEVRAHQQELEQLREKYTFTQTATTYQLDKQGMLAVKKSETHEITFYRGQRIWRLVAKNGQPLSAGEQVREDRRIEKVIRDLEAGKKIDIPHNQRRLRLSDLMRVARFTNPRRERYRQREVIVFDFEPAPSFRPENLDDRFIHALAGSLWIDAADLQIARAEFQLIDAFKVGGGAFFAMRPGSRFVTEQDRFNNEIWLPTFSQVTINARAMVFAGFSIIQRTAFDNYRRFDVKSEEMLKAPTAGEKRGRP
jgi:hypothetical protein